MSGGAWVLARTDASGAFRAAASEPATSTDGAVVRARDPDGLRPPRAVSAPPFVLGTGDRRRLCARRTAWKVRPTLNLANAHQNAVTDATGYYAFKRLPEGEAR